MGADGRGHTRRKSVGPAELAVDREVVGIGLRPRPALLWLDDGVGESVLLGEGHGFGPAVEGDADLVGGVAGRHPAHQWPRAAPRLATVFSDPPLGLLPAGLHGVLGRLLDANPHDTGS